MATLSSRRGFLRAAAATAASYGRVSGANDRIRLGVIGTGPRGQYLMKEIGRTGSVEFVAVCDVYSVRRDAAAGIAGGGVKTYSDHRQLLDHKDIDAVVVATPDHWHSAVAVDALKAGKDVYVEKPMVHYPKDGQAIVKAVRENKRVLQVGMQARAIPHYQEARMKFVESGAMGKIALARAWYDSNRGYILTAPPGMEAKPEGLDWDRWLGPGPRVPWNPEIYFSPYKWLHYDGGMIMGIGIHQIDSVHQFLKLTSPAAAVAGGGVYVNQDGRDTPDVVNLILEYPEKVNVTFEAEIATAGKKVGSYAGIEFRGVGGVLTVLRYDSQLGYRYAPHPENSQTPSAVAPGDPSNAEHIVKNWLECIRTRQKPVANEEAGYYSAMACFMANQAFQKKARIEWNPAWDLPA